ncbi:Protein YIF1B-A-like protein [Leptotrombidium deliense]|uniref:Protein YIF1 n=1 Tax=Leptotrombidium deliense TaxID=299467 RepID=A0A443SV43_9ACAR|nr:Protein YIF1B-A-like protein [Leptotrombidium deliense]
MKLNQATRRQRPEKRDQSTPFQSGGYQTQPDYTSYYDPTVGPQLFDDTSGYGSYSVQSQQAYYAPQAPVYAPSAAPFNYYEPQQPDFGIGASLLNKQMVDAGAQILQTQMAAAAGYYSQEVANKSSTWFGNLKYYFAVDTGYVLKKLLLLFLPFTHKEWSVRYNPEGAIAPKDEINAPDLYIPTMGFVTYILVAGYLLGVNDRFSPEQLGIQSSAALAWLIMEVMLVFFACYLMNISSMLGFLHLLSYSSYKFVCMIVALLVSLVFFEFGYYIALSYTSLSLGYFLLRSLRLAMESGATSNQMYSSPKSSLYLVLVICFAQPVVMYFLTRHLIIRVVV